MAKSRESAVVCASWRVLSTSRFGFARLAGSAGVVVPVSGSAQTGHGGRPESKPPAARRLTYRLARRLGTSAT